MLQKACTGPSPTPCPSGSIQYMPDCLEGSLALISWQFLGYLMSRLAIIISCSEIFFCKPSTSSASLESAAGEAASCRILSSSLPPSWQWILAAYPWQCFCKRSTTTASVELTRSSVSGKADPMSGSSVKSGKRGSVADSYNILTTCCSRNSAGICWTSSLAP